MIPSEKTQENCICTTLASGLTRPVGKFFRTGDSEEGHQIYSFKVLPAPFGKSQTCLSMKTRMCLLIEHRAGGSLEEHITRMNQSSLTDINCDRNLQGINDHVKWLKSACVSHRAPIHYMVHITCRQCGLNFRAVSDSGAAPLPGRRSAAAFNLTDFNQKRNLSLTRGPVPLVKSKRSTKSSSGITDMHAAYACKSDWRA